MLDKNTEIMFNFAENNVMRYLVYLYNTEPDKLFIANNLDDVQSGESMIFPINDGDLNIVELSLKIVPHDYKHNIPDKFMKYKNFEKIMAFVCRSVIDVYTSICGANIRKEAYPLIQKESLHIDMDDSNLIFHPVYMYGVKRDIMKCEDAIKYIDNLLQDTNVNLITEDVNNLLLNKERTQEFLSKCQYDKTVADSKEKEMEELLKSHMKIGLVYNEISKDILYGMDAKLMEKYKKSKNSIKCKKCHNKKKIPVMEF